MEEAHTGLDMSKARRQGLVMLGVLNTMVLATGVVGVVDLRRLATPGGTALRWVQAAVFGDCDDYLEFSVPDPGLSESRSPQELCEDLRQGTKEARSQLDIGLALGAVERSSRDATADVTITRKGQPTAVEVHLVHRDGRWRVVRDEVTCQSVGCA